MASWLSTAFSALALIMIAHGAWAEAALRSQLQVIYNPETREVTRQTVTVHDPHPEMGLAFLWEPDPGNWPGVTADGLADGAGRVAWRVPGTASYDPRAEHHAYEGTLRAGRFHGEGTLRYRDGSFFRGTWEAGLLQGDGEYLDATGNRYEGQFLAGRAHGTGVYRSRWGWIYEGGFADGVRHGDGEMLLPGGQRYAVVMQNGTEVDSDRPDILPDPTLGGLLPAQSGGDAGKVNIAVVIDQRITSEQSMQYTHYVDNSGVYIFPTEELLRQMWDGQLKIGQGMYLVADSTDADWNEARAYTLFDLRTTDGSRARIEALDLVVETSIPQNKPMLDLHTHSGCVGFRPTFNFINYGWGRVENARASVRFMNPESYDWNNPNAPRAMSREFPMAVGSFDQGLDVSIRDVLVQAGVDVGTLEGRRFTCPTFDMLDQCTERTRSALRWGEIGNFISAQYGELGTEVVGQLTYDWVDGVGNRVNSTEEFTARFQLGIIEVEKPLAECGGGGAFVTPAPQFTDVELRTSGQNYRIGLPLRGNPNIRELLTGAKFWAKQSSYHQFTAEARFADGSVKRSSPVRLFLFRPRMSEFQSRARPASCYLDIHVAGGC